MATRKRQAWWRRIPYRVLVTVALCSGMAVVAGVVSYLNMRATARLGHAESLVASLLGAVPDLMMGLSLLAISATPKGYRASYWAWAGFWLGLLTSVTGNEVAEWHNGWIGRATGLFLPLAVMVCVEVVRNADKRIRKTTRRPAARKATVKAPQRVTGARKVPAARAVPLELPAT